MIQASPKKTIHRQAIAADDEFLSMLDKINRVNVSIRKTIQLNNIFRDNRCRLRCECTTRWSATYLVLESIKRAYDNGLVIHFNRYNEPARNEDTANSIEVTLQDIETYMQILLPAYQWTIALQSVNSSIGDIVPGNLT